MTDKQIAALQRRNAKRVEEVKKRMGSKWLCHPANRVLKKQGLVERTLDDLAWQNL